MIKLTDIEDKLDEYQVELIVEEILKRGSLHFSSSLYNNIQGVANNLKILNIEHPRLEIALSNNDFLRCIDRIWDYLIVGALAPEMDRNNVELPWVHLTEYGKKLIIEKVNPYQSEKFVKEITDIAGELVDDIAEMYLYESLICFKHNCNLGGTVLLGAFSERVFLKFLIKFCSIVKTQSKKEKIRKVIQNDNMFISAKFREFRNMILPLKKQFPRDIKDQFELWLDGFFNYIRRVRNEVGHPTSTKVSREDVLAMYLPFPGYIKNLIKLLEYFTNSPI